MLISIGFASVMEISKKKNKGKSVKVKFVSLPVYIVKKADKRLRLLFCYVIIAQIFHLIKVWINMLTQLEKSLKIPM